MEQKPLKHYSGQWSGLLEDLKVIRPILHVANKRNIYLQVRNTSKVKGKFPVHKMAAEYLSQKQIGEFQDAFTR
jgi:hypothetical protein